MMLWMIWLDDLAWLSYILFFNPRSKSKSTSFFYNILSLADYFLRAAIASWTQRETHHWEPARSPTTKTVVESGRMGN